MKYYENDVFRGKIVIHLVERLQNTSGNNDEEEKMRFKIINKFFKNKYLSYYYMTKIFELLRIK